MPKNDRAYIEHLRARLAEYREQFGWMIDTPLPARWFYCPTHGRKLEMSQSLKHPRATCEGCVYESAEMQSAIRRDWEASHPGNLHTTGREAKQVRENALPERKAAKIGGGRSRRSKAK